MKLSLGQLELEPNLADLVIEPLPPRELASVRDKYEALKASPFYVEMVLPRDQPWRANPWLTELDATFQEYPYGGDDLARYEDLLALILEAAWQPRRSAQQLGALISARDFLFQKDNIDNKAISYPKLGPRLLYLWTIQTLGAADVETQFAELTHDFERPAATGSPSGSSERPAFLAAAADPRHNSINLPLQLLANLIKARWDPNTARETWQALKAVQLGYQSGWEWQAREAAWSVIIWDDNNPDGPFTEITYPTTAQLLEILLAQELSSPAEAWRQWQGLCNEPILKTLYDEQRGWWREEATHGQVISPSPNYTSRDQLLNLIIEARFAKTGFGSSANNQANDGPPLPAVRRFPFNA